MFSDRIYKRIKILSRDGNWTRDLSHRSLMRYFYTTEKLNTWIDVKLFNCFIVMSPNLNKQNQICESHFFNN